MYGESITQEIHVVQEFVEDISRKFTTAETIMVQNSRSPSDSAKAAIAICVGSNISHMNLYVLTSEKFP